MSEKPRTWTLEGIQNIRLGTGEMYEVLGVADTEPAPFAIRRVIELEPVLDLLERQKLLLGNLRSAAGWHPDSLQDALAPVDALLREHGRLK